MLSSAKNLKDSPDSARNIPRFIDLETLKLSIPPVGIFDSPNRCYTLNNQWAIVLLGFLDWITETYPWDETTGDVQAAIEQIHEFLVGEACGVDCNEVDDCLDTIPDWIAITNLTYQNAVNTPETSSEELEAQYDGTPQSIAPDMPTDTPDSQESNLLCYALHNFVSYYAATKASEISLTNAFQTSMNAILEAAKRIVGTNNLGLLGSILGDLTYGCAATVDDALAALQDDDAIEQVSCWLYQYLRCLAFTKIHFENAILTSTTAAYTNPNATILACMLNNDNDDDVYRIFLFGYQTAHELGEGGATLDCPCTGGFWQYDQQFYNGLGQWVVNQGTFTGSQVDAVDIGPRLQLQVQIDLPASVEVFKTRIVYQREGSSAVGSDDFFSVQWMNVNTVLNQFSGSESGVGSFDRCQYNASGTDNVNRVRVTLGMHLGASNAVHLFRVSIWAANPKPEFGQAIDVIDDCSGC